MIAEGAHAALWLAAAFALLGAWRRGSELAAPMLIAAGLLALTAALGLAWSGLAADFSLKIVDEHVHRLQTPAMRLAALARSVPGNLLLGAIGAAAGGAVVIALGQPVARPAMLVAALLMLTVALDPFSRQPVVPVEGLEMSWPPKLFMAPILVLAMAVLAVATARPLPRMPRWMILAAIGAPATVVAIGLLPPLTTEGVAREGTVLQLGGMQATVRELRPVAGPGFTAIEARVAVGGTELRPQWRRPAYGPDHSDPVIARVGVGRIQAELEPGNRLRLTWGWL